MHLLGLKLEQRKGTGQVRYIFIILIIYFSSNMVGHDSISKNLSHFQVACAGATSSFVTRALCQPFDVLKIRFQLQVEPITKSPNSKYQSIPQAFKLIVKEEGVTALWKGHVPAQLLSVVYGIGQFWSFELLSKEAHKLGLYEGRYRPAVNFACGALAGKTVCVLLGFCLIFAKLYNIVQINTA